MSFPVIPLPFTSVALNHVGGTSNSDQHQQQHSQRRQNARQLQQAASRNPNSLHTLLLDEAAIASRKAAIATYGYSWLQPAGVAKTMLGRREEEIEREELERQMREQEEMEIEMERGEEMARQAALREQQMAAEAGTGTDAQRDLDDDIPDADDNGQEEQEQEEGETEADLDNDIPDADADQTFADDSAFNVEGVTGITDEVEDTNLGSDDHSLAQNTRAHPTLAPPRNRAPVTGSRPSDTRPLHTPAQLRHEWEQQALAAVQEGEQEQNLDTWSLDEDDELDEIDGRDLDDDVPQADEEDDEGEWQHTDTELELEDESAGMLLDDEEDYPRQAHTGDLSMDMSAISGFGPRRTSLSGNVFAGSSSRPVPGAAVTPAGANPGSSTVPSTSASATSPSSPGRNWLYARSLFGITRPRASGASETQAQTPAEESHTPQSQYGDRETRSRRPRSGRNG